MRPYSRILALVDLSKDAMRVTTRASQMAQFHAATLAIATVVDYPPGLECDHVPFLTPEEFRRAFLKDVTGKLNKLASGASARRAEIIIVEGEEPAVVDDLLWSWRPDLVVLTDSAAPLAGEARANGRRPAQLQFYDVLRVQAERPGLVGRFVQALSFGF
jgi:hypothetical protein